MKDDKPMELHPQRCYECRIELKDGDQAVAAKDWPVAFCTKCRKPDKGYYALAVIKAESSG